MKPSNGKRIGNNLYFHTSSIEYIPSDEKKAKHYLYQLLKNKDRPTAIFTIQEILKHLMMQNSI